MQAAKQITFGKFRLDLANECLWQGSRAVPLRPKAFAVLKLLLENPGQLVNKQLVLDTVWPGTFVGDAVLKDNIRQLREALQDDAESPAYIETAHRRGYRFIAKISSPASEGNRPVFTSKTAVLPLAASMPASAGIRTDRPVLGRDAELAKMRAGLERASAGARQIIFITGEPGIGKSTLVQAFLDQVVPGRGILVARGQCFEHYGAGEAYLPVLDGFARLCRSSEGAEVLNLLRQHAPAWLAQMPSLVPPGERQSLHTHSAGASRERMLREMAEAIETLTTQSPLVLVLEDLHWSDYSTLDLVSYLARRVDPARLMVIGTYRPVDVIVADHPLKGVKRELQAHGLCSELALESLDEGAVAQYLLARFNGHELPTRLRRAIHRRTEGNPLFMVTLVEYLVDQEVIAENAGEWKAEMDCSEIEQGIPGNLRQLIEKQLERLNPEERAVLEAATVAGMECSSAAIAAGLNMPLEWVEKHCEELAHRHQFLSPAWLFELPDKTITPRHRFNHILYREVPYRLIPPLRRSLIHQRIGERGVEIWGDRDSEIAAPLAMHFEQSHDWPRALKYLLQAAENAGSRSAHHEAADLATRGLEALKFLPQSPEHAQKEMKLRMILAVSLMAIKGFASEEVEKINARGRELFWLHGPSPELFYMLWSLGIFYQFNGELQASLDISLQILELAEGLGDGALVMEAHRAVGGALVVLGRCAEALDHLEKATALYETHHDHRHRVFIGRDCKVICEGFAALALWVLGYPDQALNKVVGALELARRLDHPQTLIAAAHFAVHIYQFRGEAALALKYAKEVVRLADEYGLQLWVAYGHIELGWAEAELGPAEPGIEHMKRGFAAYDATGAKLWSPYMLGLLADQFRKAGRVSEGLETIVKALAQAKQSGDGYSTPELHRIHGELILKSHAQVASGNPDVIRKSIPETIVRQARSHFAESLASARAQQAKSWELRTLLSLNAIEVPYLQQNHQVLAEAVAWFQEGLETANLQEAESRLHSPITS